MREHWRDYLNGRQTGDLNGEFTFRGLMGFSVIDYGICSKSFLDLVSKFSVGCKPFSDHMPLCLELNAGVDEESTTISSNANPKLCWNNAKAHIYLQKLNQLSSSQVFDASSRIDYQIDVLCANIRHAHGGPQPKKHFKSRNFWFDWQCERARKNMLRYLNLCRKYDTAWTKKGTVKLGPDTCVCVPIKRKLLKMK